MAQQLIDYNFDCWKICLPENLLLENVVSENLMFGKLGVGKFASANVVSENLFRKSPRPRVRVG